MTLELNFEHDKGLYLKNPQDSKLGRDIVTESINLIHDIGYDKFTFKKLGQIIPTTEATIYRYFENKHKLLIYIVDIYWSIMEFQIKSKISTIESKSERIKMMVDLLVWEDNSHDYPFSYDLKKLFYIMMEEGSKTYLSKEVEILNKDLVYKPFKELNGLIANVFQEFNPNFKYSRSLASTIIEISHSQYFFMQHLPKLSSFSESRDPKALEEFMEDLIFKTLS